MWPKESGENGQIVLRPPPPSQASTPYERRQEDARNMAAYDAALEAQAEERRKAQAQAELEALATSRLTEWTDAGGTVEEFEKVWPQQMREHFARRHAVEDAERERLVNEQRIF